MGNCQAAETATVVIQHPDGKVERVYWSLNARDVMAANPGHYVAVILTTVVSKPSTAAGGGAAATVKHLKLLRPDDTLRTGHVYRLVSFEEVMKEFASKKYVKLSKLLKNRSNEERNRDSKKESRRHGGGGGGGVVTRAYVNPERSTNTEAEGEAEAVELEEVVEMMRRRSAGGPTVRRGQWRPALQSIAEFATS